jgi:enoyl-CoA hydratase
MSVYVERSGPVTTVIMERPNARNAVDPETADALVAAFEAFNRDPEAKVGVFFGSHGTFCAGWDLKYGA